jgi:Na+-driven multidrug efflux pump
VVRRSRAAGAVLALRPAGVAAVARSGGWLVVRTALLQAAVTTNTVVAAALGATALAAHQVVGGLWVLLAFALDAVAIAGQALIGSALGSGDAALGRALTRRMLGWGVVSGLAFGLALVLARPAYVGLFTPDPQVRRLVATVVLVVALQAPLAGLVYVLDGILIGAGDARYLAFAGLVSLVLYLPVALLVRHLGSGLVWVWASYAVFMTARALTLGHRARGDRWARVGA